MTAQNRALMAGIFLLFLSRGTSAAIFDDARNAYDDQHWRLVIYLLERDRSEAGALGLLAMSHFHMLEFDAAHPLLRQALDDEKGRQGLAEFDLLNALLETSLVLKDRDEAAKVIDRLSELEEEDLAIYGQARLDLDGPNRSSAKQQLRRLVKDKTVNVDIATSSAFAVVQAMLDDQELAHAAVVAELALEREPDSIHAPRFAGLQELAKASSRFNYALGYRLEYDDNVTFPEDERPSELEDFRHVFMADLLYQRPIGTGWSFYGQGHFFQSLHHDLNEFNQTRIIGAASIGQTGRKYGWRFPVELAHDRQDGDSFRTSWIATPGFFVQWNDSLYTHFYGRIQEDDFDMVLDQDGFPLAPDEDRSGTVTGVGVLLAAEFSPNFGLHSYIEFNRHDTDGLHWERDELVAYAFAEYQFIPDFVAGLALRYQDEDFDNVRQIFLVQQQDESKEFYLNVTHTFSEHWWWRAQYSRIDHDSNIPVFEYERNVYSFSISRDF